MKVAYSTRTGSLQESQLRADLAPPLKKYFKKNVFLTATDARHSVAIADMGNYQEVLRQMSPLREVDPGQNRVHMFGNPFKLAKDQVQS